jgi:tight adherence protein B
MPVYLTYVFYGAVFLSVLLLVEGLFYLLAGPGGGAAASPNRRLRLLVGGEKREQVMVRLQRERPLPATDHPRDPVEWFIFLVAQSGARLSPQRVILLMVAVGAAAAALLMLINKSAIVAAIGAVSAGFVLPILILTLKRSMRWKAMTAQLPDAIDIMVRSLKAGHPVATSINMVARETRDPLATEFGLVVDEMTYGLNLETALSNMARRVGLSDLRFLVVAVTVQVEVGGNLAEILSSLSRVIRERAKMRAKIRALSAEGRFSAVLLTVLPFALIGVINLVAPKFYSAVKDDPVFWPILGFGFFLMLMGVIVMYRMVNFRV